MTIFDSSMLTASPSPSPEPEGLPSSATGLIMQEESEETRIMRTWRTICDQVHTIIQMVPDAHDELIEKQESWMREWSVLLMSMTACGKTAQELKIPLHMEGEDSKALAYGRKSHCSLEKLIKSWKAKAILPVKESPEVTTACPVQCAVEVASPVAESSSKAPAPAEEEECVIPEDMGEPGASLCQHLQAKRKAHTVPTAHASKVTKAHESTVKSMKHVPASTIDSDADKSSSNGKIKVVGEHTTEEKIICGARIILPHPTKPLPIHAAPAPLSKGKSKAVNSEEVLMLVLAENADLVMCLREVLTQVQHHAWTEQVEMITLSNKVYVNAQSWANVEHKMSELLD
ncbi:hypothetical protein BDR05DRAFT_947724 [Suillus weaverae]|nr:hypothetical protein BDR05DRAFT_947724 [Suillus weaverae]